MTNTNWTAWVLFIALMLSIYALLVYKTRADIYESLWLRARAELARQEATP